MTRTITKTYRYRLTPTVAQATMLNQFAGARRFVWNWALARKKDHYRLTGKTLGFAALSRELTQLKREPATAWLREMESQSLQQVLRDLEAAYQTFFQSAKRGDKGDARIGFPRFKSRKTDTPRFRIPQRVDLDGSFVSVPKIGRVRAVIHRPLDGVTKSATFKREPDGHWYVCLVTEQQVAPRSNAPVRTHVGVDLGVKSLAVCSNGQTIINPRWYRVSERKLRRANKALSRKAKGSKNRAKAKRVVARLHRTVAHRRSDVLHKLSSNLIRQFDLVSIEDLHVGGLAKTKLSKSVYDAGWSTFRAMLTYKADWYDRHVVAVSRFFPSSKMCGVCGTVNADLTLSDRVWTCVCGVRHDRDLNAAQNIDREGKRLFDLIVAAGDAETQNACGASVRPIHATGTRRRSRKPTP